MRLLPKGLRTPAPLPLSGALTTSMIVTCASGRACLRIGRPFADLPDTNQSMREGALRMRNLISAYGRSNSRASRIAIGQPQHRDEEPNKRARISTSQLRNASRTPTKST